MPSLRGFAKKRDATNTRKMCWWVAPDFIFYNELKTTNSPRQMAKQHQITLKFETYLVGKLTNVIWGEYWDAKYFVDNSTKMSFEKMFHDMYELNLETQRTIQHVMRTLMGLPYNWTTLDECYRRQP